jgi:hypothetical protein
LFDPAGDFCTSERERISRRRTRQMPMQRYKPEQIVTVLRQIEVAMANGKSTPRRPARRLGFILRRIIGGGRSMEV